MGLAVSGAVLLAMLYLPMYFNTYCIIPVTYGFFNASFQGIYGIALVKLFDVDKMTAALFRIILLCSGIWDYDWPDPDGFGS